MFLLWNTGLVTIFSPPSIPPKQIWKFSYQVCFILKTALVLLMMKRAACCLPRKMQQLTLTSTIKNGSLNFLTGWRRRCKQKRCIFEFQRISIFLFFKILCFWGIFGIKTCYRFLWQKYNKNSKFWKKNCFI